MYSPAMEHNSNRQNYSYIIMKCTHNHQTNCLYRHTTNNHITHTTANTNCGSLLLSLNIHVEKYCTNVHHCLLLHFTTTASIPGRPGFPVVYNSRITGNDTSGNPAWTGMHNATCEHHWARLVAVNESVTDAAVCPQPVTDAYLIMDEQSACVAVADTEPWPQFTAHRPTKSREAMAAECGVD